MTRDCFGRQYTITFRLTYKLERKSWQLSENVSNSTTDSKKVNFDLCRDIFAMLLKYEFNKFVGNAQWVSE